MRKNGFTLMEMLIVVTIIGILASIVLPRIYYSADASRKTSHRKERALLNTQLETYYFLYGLYPVSMTSSAWSAPDDSEDYTQFFPDGVPSTCNQGVGWSVTDGRINTSAHANHE